MKFGGHEVSVICPGGMMACSSTEVMRAAGARGPEVHAAAAAMTLVALGIADETGFDNVGVPFCMTVEAEAFGARVDLGDLRTEPAVVTYAAERLEDVIGLRLPDPGTTGRMPVVLDAIASLASDGRLVVGSLTGPVSLLTSLVDASTVYRAMRSEPEMVHGALRHVTDALKAFGNAMIDAGAGALMIAEPSGTGDILGERWFTHFAEARLAELTREFLLRTDVLLHVCGDVRTIVSSLIRIPMTAFSFDSVVSVEELRSLWPDGVFIGNLSTHALHKATPTRIHELSSRLHERGIAIVAPACGMAADTPAENIRALTTAAHRAACDVCRAVGGESSPSQVSESPDTR